MDTDEDRLSLIRPSVFIRGWNILVAARRAKLYRRFLTCQISPASNALPITNRRYGRLKICATLSRYERAIGSIAGRFRLRTGATRAAACTRNAVSHAGVGLDVFHPVIIHHAEVAAAEGLRHGH